jgi:hypothetical protein
VIAACSLLAALFPFTKVNEAVAAVWREYQRGARTFGSTGNTDVRWNPAN